ncbi:malto-oligosyltrehalose synthase [Gluconacetobacter takamatsuzukensis]|uniref:Malto-oligosyltrehalose synthase n=1 Tax=Gluconacetobacter takamatsuzukensis TaxID=1286190 RepID=A0A7W4KEM0_9PROT|nr:malto-oligosyltrehalose synthase [Gluconacetobacter takamatsuzukensis]MBB2205484.1 malto-oligosyltrehalose synthase [Gluconacetobacter takamatsuzukensis]
MTGPRATVRLQFHAGFTLDDAVPLVDYFASLGVSHLYASPLLAARPGSTHGYDTLDYSRINPELGGHAALARLVARLRARGMGLILDIVPNHMAVGGSGNAWWEDVLAWGRTSPCAHMFDIDWSPPDDSLRDRVLLPFLAEPYGDCLDGGTLELRHAPDGTFACWHYEHRFPICPRHYADLFDPDDTPAPIADLLEALRTATPDTAAPALARLAGWARTPDGTDAIARALAWMAPAHPAGRARLHALLERQHYRLAWWRTASDLINWRRFFDITGLAGLAVEHPDVFDAVHRTVIALYAEGLIDGVRVDHVDGLTNPHAYCTRLHRALADAAPRRPPHAPPGAPLYVEKILAADETLPADWPVDGTTGYDFLEQVDVLLHDQRGADALDDLWVWGAGGATSFHAEEQATRAAMLDGTLAADLARLVHVLSGVARRDPHARDFTPAALDRVLRRILIQFPVYRTYDHDGGKLLHEVCQSVRPALVAAQQPVLDWLARQLGPGGPAQAIACLVHLTAPLAAKAVEDTGFYRYGRLLSRNDVGTHPGRFGGTVAAFHAANAARRRDWPRAMLATATHDHKRGEDARARLAVLSELAQEWVRVATRWRDFNAPLRHRASPDRADELILYQTLLGAWPVGDRPLEQRMTPDFHDRVAAWQLKALREAKRHTSWIDPNPAYEQACAAFLAGLLSPDPENRFPRMMDAFAGRIAPPGALNGLAQTLLRLTSPGMPDLYQGCEFWDFSLVDPDNRRPVDFPARIAALAQGADIGTLLPHWRDGRVKQALIAAILRFRATHPDLFATGAYRPVRVLGTRRQHLLAFARVMPGITMLVIAPRLPAALMPDPTDLSCPAMLWRSTTLDWPDAPPGPWRSLLHPGRTLDRAAVLDLAMLAGSAPLDVLVTA